jgi:RNase P subunit RPR2
MPTYRDLGGRSELTRAVTSRAPPLAGAAPNCSRALSRLYMSGFRDYRIHVVIDHTAEVMRAVCSSCRKSLLMSSKHLTTVNDRMHT